MGSVQNRFCKLLVALTLLVGASAFSVKADTLTPTAGSTPFTIAVFTPTTFDGSQTISQGGALNVLGCPKASPQPACTDSGSVSIFFAGAGANQLIVQGSKFWVNITGNLSSIFSSYTASGVAVTNSLVNLTTLTGQACYESTLSPSVPTVHGIADAICTTGSQSSDFAITMIAPDTFEASNGSIGVTFSLASTATPEPATFGMLLAGLAGLGLVRRNRFLGRS